MTASDLVRRLHRHRMWVNHRLMEAVSPLGEEQLRRPLPIGQGSVWRTLTHLIAAESNWLEALLGNEVSLFPGDGRASCPAIRRAMGRSHRSTNWPRCGGTSTGGGTSTWRA